MRKRAIDIRRASLQAPDAETLPAFERTATEFKTRIGFLIDAIEETTNQEVTEQA